MNPIPVTNRNIRPDVLFKNFDKPERLKLFAELLMKYLF
jgi:hypothetical protein